MTKIICDVCGEVINTSVTTKPLYRVQEKQFFSDGLTKNNYHYKDLDICDECQKEIDAFFIKKLKRGAGAND